MKSPQFRQYAAADHAACMALFESNCPEFFAPYERRDYTEYLADSPKDYVVCQAGEKIIGAYGTCFNHDDERGHLSWILIDPNAQGSGVGTQMVERVLTYFQSENVDVIEIAASQKSAPFFARFGAVEVSRTVEGWGPGLDRVEMELSCDRSV